MVDPNFKHRYPNAAEALDALIPLEVLRPIELPKLPLTAIGLLALCGAVVVPVLMLFVQPNFEPKVKPKKVEKQNTSEVIVTTDPKSLKNLDGLSMKRKRVYFSVNLSALPNREYKGICQLFDGAGILVAMGQSPLKIASSGLKAWCWYDFKEDDLPGDWTFKFSLEGQKVVEKNLTVIR